MAAQTKPTCEIEINFLADLEEEGLPYRDQLPKDFYPEDLPDDKRQSFVKRKKLVALKALTEWTEQLKVVEGKLSRRTKRVDCLTNEIYQLVGLYSVFVGVVFTAVQADRVQCQHIWSPILLCLLPCLIIALIVDKKLVEFRLIRKDIDLDESSRRVHLTNLGKLKAFGYRRFDFSKHAAEENQRLKNGNESIRRFGAVATLVISSLVAALSFLHILCWTKSHVCEGGADWNDYAPGLVLPS